MCAGLSDDEIKDCLTDIHDKKLDTTQGQKRIKDAKEMRYVMIVCLIVFRFVRLCLIAFLVQYLDLKLTLPKSGKKTRSREKDKSEVSVLRASFLSLRALDPIVNWIRQKYPTALPVRSCHLILSLIHLF